MLNYIKAELYRVRQRIYLLNFILILLGLEALFILLSVFPRQQEYAQMIRALDMLMPVGLILTLVFVDLIFSAQYRHNTLKNECAFGIPRARIYLGKFCAELLLGLGILLLVLAVYLGSGWVLALHGDPTAEAAAFQHLGLQLSSALPLWIASLSMAHFLFFLIKSDVLAVTLLILSSLFGFPLAALLGALTLGLFQPVAETLVFLLPNTRFELMRSMPDGSYLLGNWLVGLVWFFVTTTAGLAIFKKRTIP